VEAQAAGTTGASFLTLGSGARIEAVAGCGTALACGVDALYWNPAAIGMNSRSEFSFSHAALFADIGYEHIGYVYPLTNATCLGVSSSILHTGGIPRTFEDPYGLYRETDGSFSYTAMATSLTAGKYAGQGIYVGGSVKFVYEDNANEAAAGLAFDVSGLYISRSGVWSMGVAARNLGSGLKAREVTEPLPSQVGIGGALALADSCFLASVEATLTPDAGTRFSWGVEQRVRGMLFLRGGYITSTDRTAHRGFTVGAGIALKGFSIDYSTSDFQELGLVHRFTLGVGGR
ncbi:MAG: PorV/PorQ family protein, partial [Candidatus Eisenbacteria bacterium]